MTARMVSKKNRNSYSKKDLDKSVNFEFYSPLAKEVSVAGEFNDWDAGKNKLKKDANGWWKAALSLKPGRYEYRFLVDGNWENDPVSIEFVPNSFGTWNCVIEIR